MLDSWGSYGIQRKPRGISPNVGSSFEGATTVFGIPAIQRRESGSSSWRSDAIRIINAREATGRKSPHEITVRLAPDAAETFPDADSVNEALRDLIRIAKSQMNSTSRSWA